MSQRVASVCRRVTLVNFLPTSGCIQDPVSLTSVDPATTAGFTFFCTTNGKKKNVTQDLTVHILKHSHSSVLVRLMLKASRVRHKLKKKDT